MKIEIAQLMNRTARTICAH